MQLIQKSNCFREIVQQWTIHDQSATINPSSIPAGTMLSIEQVGEDGLICTIYREHPFNVEVLAARKIRIMLSDSMEYPTLKYNVTDWDVAKFKAMQEKAQTRLEKYIQASIKYKSANEAYTRALAKQRTQIEASGD
jgi:hypothetical protein